MPYSRISDVLIHLCAGLAFISLPLLFMSGMASSEGFAAIFGSWGYWAFCLIYIAIFYLHTYIIIPKLYLTKRFLSYTTVVLALFALVLWVRPFEQLMRKQRQPGQMQYRPQPRDGEGFRPRPPGNDGQRMSPPPGFNNGPLPMGPRQGGPGNFRIDIVSICLYVMTIALGMAIQVTRQWRMTRQMVVKAEADKAQAELSFLKAQINPHFLFNTLNNIYTLAVTKNEMTADSIMKLSNIMRYVTDDVLQHTVLLQQELDCINDFISLQRLRLNKKTQVNFTIDGDAGVKKIAPLLLMTFVENVFKYGISNHEASHVTIKITIAPDTIKFYSHNKIFTPVHAGNRTGIGIANTQKRLEHMYAGKHSMSISHENGFFTVALLLQA